MTETAMLASAESLVARLTDGAVAWLLTYLVHSTLILLATWAITSRMRMSDTIRDLFWKTALVGGIVTASLQTAVGREPLGGQLRLAPRTAGAAMPNVRLSVRAELPRSAPRILVMQPRGTRWTFGLLVVWLTTAGCGLLWLTAGHAGTLRILGGRAPLDGTPISDRMRALLARVGVRQRVELSCSDRIASPVALAGSEVCLPRRALMELDPAEQDSMLAHEIAHLVRRDPQWLIAARVIETVLFMQPLNRLARHRLQEVAEYLCDDWAVARTNHPVTLAKCLAAVAEWVDRVPRTDASRLQPMSAMVESRGSPLVRRVGRILGERSAPRAAKARSAFGVSACALIAMVGVAPRISVVGGALSNRVTVLRETAEAHGMMPIGDSAFVLRRGVFRVTTDSLLRQPHGDASARGVMGRANVVYERVVVERSQVDSVGSLRVWTRPVPVKLR
jgi:beta-lactamase regulating signal transducer with metallopeptidase domain